MISETSKNSQNQALEERLSNMHEQRCQGTGQWHLLKLTR